jgi:UDP-2-acetamido-3-amino-2,3-dideoxy-glucuronate N-acetyltransferase
VTQPGTDAATTDRPVAAPPTAHLHELTWVAQERGHLLAGQFPDQVPFVPHRFFVVTAVPPGESRGQHAHRQCHQFLVALQGSVAAKVWDADGHRTHILDSCTVGLHMPPMTYGTQVDYSDDAVLLVLASHPYDVEDYLDSFEEFCALTGNRY